MHWAKLIHRHCCLTRRQVATIMVMTGSINDTWHLYWLHVLGMKTGRIHYLQWHSQDLEVGVTGCLGDRSLQAWSRDRWSPWRLTAYYGYLAAKLCTFLCIKPNCMSRWYTRWSCTPPIQKQTETVGLVQSSDIIIYHNVWPRWAGTSNPPPIFSPQILAVPVTQPDWG